MSWLFEIDEMSNFRSVDGQLIHRYPRHEPKFAILGSHITYNTHSMKCTLTIIIKIHIINYQRTEFERYFTDWIANHRIGLKMHNFWIRWAETQSAIYLLKIKRRDLKWWRIWTPRPNWMSSITALGRRNDQYMQFYSQWFDLHIYTTGLSVENLVNTLQVSSDSGNLCLDINQGQTQWILFHL